MPRLGLRSTALTRLISDFENTVRLAVPPNPVLGPLLVAIKNLEPRNRPLMRVLDLSHGSFDIVHHRQPAPGRAGDRNGVRGD